MSTCKPMGSYETVEERMKRLKTMSIDDMIDALDGAPCLQKSVIRKIHDRLWRHAQNNPSDRLTAAVMDAQRRLI